MFPKPYLRGLLLDLRHFDFKVEFMRDAKSRPFREAVKAVCGMTNHQAHGMLSSLASELAFNDLRDAGKRHSRREKTCGANLHAVASKSASKRTFGCESLTLSAEDWSGHLERKAIKAQVYSALRATDVSLGIDSTGLTKSPSNVWLTKPHIFCQRLELLWLGYWLGVWLCLEYYL